MNYIFVLQVSLSNPFFTYSQAQRRYQKMYLESGIRVAFDHSQNIKITCKDDKR